MPWISKRSPAGRAGGVPACSSISAGSTPSDESSCRQDPPVERERWNVFYQATSVGQYHGTFHSPYSGPFSLQNYPERDVSLTTTLFFGFRPEKNTAIYFDPEIAIDMARHMSRHEMTEPAWALHVAITNEAFMKWRSADAVAEQIGHDNGSLLLNVENFEEFSKDLIEPIEVLGAFA